MRNALKPNALTAVSLFFGVNPVNPSVQRSSMYGVEMIGPAEPEGIQV
jgi:hypothetical protein